MLPGEEYELRRKNFIEKSRHFFGFLCDEFGYSDPAHSFYEQANGTIISDSLEYSNASLDRLIVLYNAYHPNDYGFEVQFFRPSISVAHADRVMAHYLLKEDQDIEQTYLEDAARLVREKYLDVISGRGWFDSI